MTLQETTNNQALDTTTPSTAAETSSAPRSWASAAVDVLEGEDSFLVLADVPGVAKERIEVTYHNGELRIVARRESGSSELWPMDYKRTIQLPREIDAEHISAELRDGVLNLSIPKSEVAKPRSIPVSTS